MFDSDQLAALRRKRVPASGNKVAMALKLAGHTQAEMSRRTGLSRQYICDVSTGRRARHLTIQNAWRFAEFFGVDPGVLFPAPPPREKAEP